MELFNFQGRKVLVTGATRGLQGRVNGEDIKGACIFLASHASDYLNGAVIPVDGGYASK